jgi:hypothetical protein
MRQPISGVAFGASKPTTSTVIIGKSIFVLCEIVPATEGIFKALSFLLHIAFIIGGWMIGTKAI